METIQGQDILLNDFGKGAFSMIIVEDMEPKDVSALKEKIEAVDHVDSVIWYDSIADISIPMDILPDKIKDAFNTDHSTVMAVFFDTSTSADETMDAINTIRDVTSNQCFVSGMSAMVTDLKKPLRAGRADICRYRSSSCCSSNDALYGFVPDTDYLPRKYRYGYSLQLRQ